MDQMETVIQRLSEIEGAGVRLEEAAAEQKKQIAAEYAQKTLEFDQEIDAKTDRELGELNEKLEREAQEELQKMRRETQQELDDMEREYNQNHEKLAEGIFNKLIGE